MPPRGVSTMCPAHGETPGDRDAAAAQERDDCRRPNPGTAGVQAKSRRRELAATHCTQEPDMGKEAFGGQRGLPRRRGDFDDRVLGAGTRGPWAVRPLLQQRTEAAVHLDDADEERVAPVLGLSRMDRNMDSGGYCPYDTSECSCDPDRAQLRRLSPSSSPSWYFSLLVRCCPPSLSPPPPRCL